MKRSLFAVRLFRGSFVLMRSFSLISSFGLAFALCMGCSSGPNNTNTTSNSSGGSGGAGGGGTGGASAMCMSTTPIPCEDNVVQEMDLKNNLAPGLITDAVDGNGFWSTIDARAGGFMYTDSYVYAKFTDKGLVKVDLTDEQSIGSMDWDLAFRRFVIRINSGNSGPSCVTAARLKIGGSFDDLMAVPADANFLPDEYFAADCTVIPDGSGLGSPATVMSGFWTYSSCVQIPTNLYVLQKADGTRVKLTVTDYYEPTFQEQCNTTGSVPMGTPGAMMRMRWAFLP